MTNFTTTRPPKDDARQAVASPAPASPPQFLTRPDLARFLGISERTLARLDSTGEGVPYVRLGRRLGYLVADVEAWMVERRFKSGAAELAAVARDER